MKKLLLLLIVLPLFAQTTPPGQTTNPVQKVNVQWVNGTSPGYWTKKTTGLNLSIGPGVVNCNGSISTYNGTTVAVTDNAVTWGYLSTTSGCAPVFSTTQPSCNQPLFAKITASGGQITEVLDLRLASIYCVAGGAAGHLSLTPGAIDFGSVQSGQISDPRYLTISNTGDGIVTITNTVLSGDPFSSPSLNACNTDIDGGASCVVPFTCAPSVNGSVNGTVTFTSTAAVDPDNPLVVPLHCTGTSSATYLLSMINGGGTGTGTLASDDALIACNISASLPNSGSCQINYTTGSDVVITATPTNGSTLTSLVVSGVAGNCANPCTVNVTATTTITATFAAPATNYVLSTTGGGSGIGTWVSNVAANGGNGILNCKSTAGVISSQGNSGCSGSFPSGTVVTLTETPDSSSSFTGWGGPCTGTATTCQITLTSNVNVSLNFAPTSAPLSLIQTATNCSVVTTTVACNWAQPQNAGDFIVVFGAWPDATTTVSSVADTKTNTYTQVPTISPKVGTGITQVAYYSQNIAAATAGANTTTMTLSSSAGASPTFTQLTTGNGTGNSASYATASITPTSNNIIMLAVAQRLGSGNGPSAPTSITGDGESFTAVKNVSFGVNQGTGRSEHFDVYCGVASSATTGALTINVSPGPDYISWTVDQSANAASTCATAIGISAVNSVNTSTASPMTVTMGTFNSTSSATYGAGHVVGDRNLDPDAGMTMLGFSHQGNDSTGSEFASSNISPVTMLYDSTNARWAIVGVEIQRASSGRRDIRAAEYAGVKVSGSPIDVSAAAVGTSATPAAGSVTTTAAQDLMVGAAASLNTVSAADTTHGWTQRIKNTFGDDVEDQQGVASGAAVNFQPTLAASSNWVAMNIGFLNDGGGGSTTSYSVTLLGGGAGFGRVTGNTGTPLIDCDMNAGVCGGASSSLVSSGSTLTLTATPDAGSTFVTWGGVTGCSTAITCIVPNITSNQTVTARFDLAGVKNYYVSKTGSPSDSNNGLCPTTTTAGCTGGPWATISKAAATTLVIGADGTVVNVGPGTYNEGNHTCNGWNAALCITQGGLSNTQRIAYVCTTAWSQPSSSGCLIRGGNASGITVIANNIDIGDVPKLGFDLSGSAYVSGIQLEGTSCSGTCTTGNNVRIRGNFLHDMSQTANDGGPGGTGCPSSGAIQAGHGDFVQGVRVIGNLFSNIGLQSLAIRNGGGCNWDHAIYVNSPNAVIQNNIIQDAVAYGIHNYHCPSGTIIANNTVVRTGVSGIIVAGGGGTGCPTGGLVSVVNNIVDVSGRYGIQLGTGGGSPSCDATHQIYVANNIGNGNPSGNIGQANSCTVVSGTISEAPSTTFTSYPGTSSDNYALKAGSAAIGGGTQTCVTGGTFPCTPTFDFLDTVRTTPYSIGAFE